MVLFDISNINNFLPIEGAHKNQPQQQYIGALKIRLIMSFPNPFKITKQLRFSIADLDLCVPMDDTPLQGVKQLQCVTLFSV